MLKFEPTRTLLAVTAGLVLVTSTVRAQTVTLRDLTRHLHSSSETLRRVIAPRPKPFKLIYPKRSQSVGKPYRGRLVNGRRFPDGRGYVYKGRARFATDETVSYVIRAIERVLVRYPSSANVIVKDFSREKGRRLRPHRSHQSGRDVDIGYYFKENWQPSNFKTTWPSQLDADKTWFFVEQLLKTRAVKHIFIDYRLQKPLYYAAKDHGWRDEDLAKLIEYPNGRNSKVVVRHIRGHRTHMHVRFVCPPSDSECED
ncbi:MAG: penicillin-insensitive murein endopeptidase [Myxococcales bacterium]|nr:penicillin-insensitive murein endopeptidase [Myxococcales bacterium]